MSSNSATLGVTQQSIKAYVDSQLTAQDLDFRTGTAGVGSVDLDLNKLHLRVAQVLIHHTLVKFMVLCNRRHGCN